MDHSWVSSAANCWGSRGWGAPSTSLVRAACTKVPAGLRTGCSGASVGWSIQASAGTGCDVNPATAEERRRVRVSLGLNVEMRGGILGILRDFLRILENSLDSKS